jgi:AsmA-like C-terminal region
MKSRRKHKKKFHRLATVFVTLLLLILTGPFWIGWIIGIKLRSEVSQRTGATLHTGLVIYLPPYTLHLTHARLILPNSADPILGIAELRVSLARLPLGTGPLLISELEITRPILHLTQNTGGLSTSSIASTSSTSSMKLSDIFELRHVAITDGKVQYDGQSVSAAAPPVVWEHLSADLKTTPISRANYLYQFIAHDAPLADISSAGQIDIDTLLLNATSFTLDSQTKSDQPAKQLPSHIQEIFRRFAVAGHVTLTAAARIPLTDPTRGIFTAELRLTNGSTLLPDWNAPISPVQLSIDCYKLADEQATPPTTLPDELPTHPTDIRFHLNQFLLQCDKQTIRLDTGEARITPIDHTWAVGKITGLVYVGDGPGPVRDINILAYLPISAAGFGQTLPQNTFNFQFAVDNGQMQVSPQKVPLEQIKTVLTLTKTKISTTKLTAQLYGGQFYLDGLADWSPAVGVKYAGQSSITNVDMRKIADKFISDPADRQRVSGAGDLNIAFSGNIAPPVADRFAARGDLDIRHGHFFVVPILKDILRRSKHDDPATVGEFAATFDISHRNINFPWLGASSPVVGVQGSGRITFDNNIDMTLAVSPMANWRKAFLDTKIPVLSEVGAFLAGNAQEATNAIIRDAVDQFRVTGKANNPNVTQVPVPIINDAVQSLFREMSFAKAEDALVKELRRRHEAEAATQQSQ